MMQIDIHSFQDPSFKDGENPQQRQPPSTPAFRVPGEVIKIDPDTQREDQLGSEVRC